MTAEAMMMMAMMRSTTILAPPQGEDEDDDEDDDDNSGNGTGSDHGSSSKCKPAISYNVETDTWISILHLWTLLSSLAIFSLYFYSYDSCPVGDLDSRNASWNIILILDEATCHGQKKCLYSWEQIVQMSYGMNQWLLHLEQVLPDVQHHLIGDIAEKKRRLELDQPNVSQQVNVSVVESMLLEKISKAKRWEAENDSYTTWKLFLLICKILLYQWGTFTTAKHITILWCRKINDLPVIIKEEDTIEAVQNELHQVVYIGIINCISFWSMCLSVPPHCPPTK